MTVTVQSFRNDYPEFASTTAYPNSLLTYHLAYAGNMLDPLIWGSMIDIATALYVAHNIVLERRAVDEAANGGIPGESVGVLNSKSVDKVSAGYDVGAATEEKGGHWNKSIYGIRLYRLMRQFGAKPIFIGVGTNQLPFNGPAWSGPPMWPGWLSS